VSNHLLPSDRILVRFTLWKMDRPGKYSVVKTNKVMSFARNRFFWTCSGDSYEWHGKCKYCVNVCSFTVSCHFPAFNPCCFHPWSSISTGLGAYWAYSGYVFRKFEYVSNL